MFAPSVGTMVDGEHAFATSGGPAWRRRQRRLRTFRRFVLWHSKMEVAAALHHSSGLRTFTTAQFSSTAVEPIAPRVVGSLPPVEEFTLPVYDHVHQEQFAAGEMSVNKVEIPVVQEQVIVQAIPEVVDSLPPAEEFTGPGLNQVHHEHFAAVPAATEFFPMSDDEGGELSAGLRPAPLWEPLPQERVQRHTVELIIESFVPVQVLDAPVPQLGEGEQLVEFFQKFDVPVVPESDIEVPKISLDMARRRLGDYLRPPLMAEQLVEVPTIVSYSSLFLRTAEQIIDIPVPQDRGVCGGEGGLQGFSPGLGSTAYSGADLVDIPVPGSGGGEVLVEVFKVLAQDWIQQCFVEQIQQRLPSKSLIFQFCMVPLPIFIKILLRQQVLLVCWIWQIKGFFCTFPRVKKSARLGPHTGSEMHAESSPSTRRAYGGLKPVVGELDLGHWVDEFGRCWTRSLACPSRWFLQDTSELVWWEEPDEPG